MNKLIDKVRWGSLKPSLDVEMKVDVRNVDIKKRSACDEGDDCIEEEAVVDQEVMESIQSCQDATYGREQGDPQKDANSYLLSCLSLRIAHEELRNEYEDLEGFLADLGRFNSLW